MPVSIKRTVANDPALAELVRMLDAELRRRNGDETQDVMDQFNHIDPSFKIVLAYDGDTAAGCGSFKEFDSHTIEIKRMFVLPAYRGMGVAAAVINGLETWAAELGYKNAVLETGTRLTEAVRLYSKAGYNVRPQYGQYINVEHSVCMEKALN
jgi:GNAT superfamily N-acetyltransferase